jgi:uncharacterized membrane protein
MKKQTLKHLAVSSALLGLMLTASVAGAQVRGIKMLPGKRVGASASQAPVRPSTTPGSPTYAFTLLNYPGQLYTFANGINKGATTSKVWIVGSYGLTEDGFSGGGFLTRVSGTKTVTEAYQAVNYPHGTEQGALGINDLGQIVGSYTDSSGFSHGYELSGGKFTEINVPFTGAFDTAADSINNSGEIVGSYNASDGEQYGFTLIGTTYTSFNYPGATYTLAADVNNNADIVGWYIDTSGVTHGYLLSGATYTSFDFPGATETSASGINDAGDIVGFYCTTSQCISTDEGSQGFLLSGETFTTIAIPGESYTQAADINNKGQIVGFYQDAAGLYVSFLATP